MFVFALDLGLPEVFRLCLSILIPSSYQSGGLWIGFIWKASVVTWLRVFWVLKLFFKGLVSLERWNLSKDRTFIRLWRADIGFTWTCSSWSTTFKCLGTLKRNAVHHIAEFLKVSSSPATCYWVTIIHFAESLPYPVQWNIIQPETGVRYWDIVRMNLETLSQRKEARPQRPFVWNV